MGPPPIQPNLLFLRGRERQSTGCSCSWGRPPLTSLRSLGDGDSDHHSHIREHGEGEEDEGKLIGALSWSITAWRKRSSGRPSSAYEQRRLGARWKMVSEERVGCWAERLGELDGAVKERQEAGGALFYKQLEVELGWAAQHHGMAMAERGAQLVDRERLGAIDLSWQSLVKPHGKSDRNNFRIIQPERREFMVEHPSNLAEHSMWTPTLKN